MEQTALRPKPMPGREPGRARAAPVRRPHAARRRTRRLRTLLLGLLAGTVLVLCGVGLGTVGATVIGMSRLAEHERRTEAEPEPRTTPTAAPGPARPAPPAAALGVEAVDAERAGALLVGIHVPGPGHSAGLVRGDILLTFAGTRVDTAADLARAVDTATPGTPVTITVRHESGGYQQLSVTPALVT
ncbi:PDZ domain-containing protein [Streptomyces sp. NPDC093252]|uniref:PDZ domain-containing protein n=1 Tax=Streptomyces sp. NPDC093252 TaxID=3154980 RepID=UPI003445FE92